MAATLIMRPVKNFDIENEFKAKTKILLFANGRKSFLEHNKIMNGEKEPRLSSLAICTAAPSPA